MLVNYFPILVFLGVSLFITVMALIMGYFFGPRLPNRTKLSAYECGFEAFQSARLPFYVRFYLVAILFIIFDLETAFLFPWAVVFRHIGWSGFWTMLVFLAILIVGFIYEWRRGALEWE